MYMRIGCFLSTAVFCLLVSGMKWDGGEVARAAVIKVTPANVQAAIDALPASTPESSKPKSLQAIVADSATYAGDEDALDFAPGTYDDIGELVLRSPLTLRRDPSMEGDVVITGELLIHIRSKGVKVEDLTFRNLEIEKFTLLGRGESTSSRTGPIEVYLSEVTLPSFLLARKAASKTATDADRNHNYSSYTGQLTSDELMKHIGTGGVPPSGTNPSGADSWRYRGIRVLSNEKGFPMDKQGRVASYSNEKWDIHYSGQETIGDHAAHILINPRYFGAGDSCPDSENFTGIEITRNVFDGTEMTAIRSLRPSDATGSEVPVPQGSKGNCFVEVDITGNTFRNIGIADYAFLRDSDGDFITDGDGERIPDNYGDLSEYAIGLFNRVRKATISDNTIEGTTHTPIVIRDTPEGGRIAVRNNLIRPAPDEGARFPRFQEAQIEIRGTADDVKITIAGNRLLGSDDYYPYFIINFGDSSGGFRPAAGWCQDPAVPSGATIAQLETLLQPRIWRSYVPGFPYPDGSGVSLSLPPEGSPVSLTGLLNEYNGNTAQLKTNIVISHWDVVRHKRCHPTARIEIRGQKGVSVTNNDLGYGEEGSVNYAITLWEFRGSTDTTLAEFSGNNVNYYTKGVIGSFGGNAATVAAKGNYLGTRPLLTRNLNKDGVVTEPVARREGDIGPRSGMTAENPPVVPRIRSAAVSPSGRNMIVLTYGTALDGESEPAAGAFSVRYRIEDGRTRIIGVDDVEVDGSTVVLTLEGEIPSGASGLTVVYSSEDAGDSAVRSTLGGVNARDDEAVVSDSDGGGMMEPGPGEEPVSKGDGGGCVLASSGSGGVGLGVLLPVAVVGLVAFLSGRKRK